MKKSIFISTFILWILLAAAVAAPVLADCNSNSDPGCAIKSTNDVYQVIMNIFRFLYDIFLVVGLIVILLAAFNYFTAKDDSSKIESAHKQILWALVAIAIALSSAGAVKLVHDFIINGQ